MEKQKRPFLTMSLVWLIMLYMAGIVVAQGYWKFAAIFFPPYAWYLFVEKVMKHFMLV